jgi:hypothetical protein
VGDDHNSALGLQTAEGLLDVLFVLGIDAGGRLIQEENRCPLEKGAGNGDSLPFSSGEKHSPLAYDRLVAFRQRSNELMSISCFCCPDELLMAGLGLSQAQVILHGIIEQVGLLSNQSHLAAQEIEGQAANIMAPQEHSALLGIVEAEEKIDDCALASSCRPNQSHSAAWLHLKRDVMQNRPIAVISEVNPLKPDLRLNSRRCCILAIPDLRHLI